MCWEGGRKLQLVINRNHGEELVAEVPDIESVPVYLKVEVEHLARSFYYSYDGETWLDAGRLERCVFLCDEGVPDDPKRHTGTMVGIYANNGGCGSRKPADFSFFRYEDREEKDSNSSACAIRKAALTRSPAPCAYLCS